jgi:hypothetical protein
MIGLKRTAATSLPDGHEGPAQAAPIDGVSREGRQKAPGDGQILPMG